MMYGRCVKYHGRVRGNPVDRQRPRAHTGEQAAEIAIFDATERLLATQALHELSVAQIIQEAGLSRASFYHYFSSKYEVVVALMGRIFEEMYSETQTELESHWDDPAASLRASLRTGMETWLEHKAVIHAALENMHSVPALADVWNALRGRFVTALTEQIRTAREEGQAAPGLAPETIAEMLVCGAERIFYVGSSGIDERLATTDERLDAIVTVAMAAIYGTPAGPAASGA
jgi:AcrR family transcriptional regulator